jgi:putative spermidine/putrescine transport system permease protein
VFFVYPCVSLLLQSFGFPQWSIAGYLAAMSDPTVTTIMLRTFAVAATVTAITLVIAYPYAYLMTRVKPRARSILIAIVLIPFWTSLLARTFAWMVILQANGPLVKALRLLGIESQPLIGTRTGVTIAMIQIMLPFMILPLYTNLSKIDLNFLRASSTLGGNGWQTFLKIYLPLSWNGVSAGALLVFIISLGFYVTPRLVGSPQQSLIGQLIELRVEELLDFKGAGVLSGLLIISFGITVAIGWGLGRSVHRLTVRKYLS